MRAVKLFLAFFIIATLASCTLTENIYLNNDGSGKFSVDMDASGLMAMMPNDSLKSQKSIDSTFSFKQLFAEQKDSIAKLSKEKQGELKKIENINMRMQMDSDAKKLMIFVNTNFKDVSELQDIMATINTLNAIQNSDKSKIATNAMMPSSGFGTNNSVLNYSYNGKKFIRKAVVNTTESKQTGEDSKQMFEAVFASSNYILKYHFPKPVKRISNSTAMYSEDRKTITIQYPFKEYMESPDKLNIEVEFE